MENHIESKDLMKLHELRLGMWECFRMLSQTPKDDPITEEFIDLMDQHQGIISKMATGQHIDNSECLIAASSGKKLFVM